MSEAVLLVGTKKGLWIGRSDERRERWDFAPPEFLMEGIYGTCVDTRAETPRVFVSGTSEHWGPGVYRRRPGSDLDGDPGSSRPVPGRPG
jgi:hypothetical protein